jgi:cytoskeleton protein RodZ
MAALGEQLSAARKKLGLTPAEVAARLRIRTSFVDALERERWAAVGAPVYVRGFLRNYSKLLGLDAEAILSQLPDEQQTSLPVQLVNPSTTADLFADPAARVRAAKWYPWLLGSLTVIAAFLVVNVAIALFGGSHSTNNAGTVTPDAAATVAPYLPQAPEGASNTLQANAAAQSKNGVNLRLSLTQASWLSVTVDGKRVVYETLPAGTIRQFHGDREISLRAGNAGGVVANFDGKDLGKLGTAGQVEDRVFAAKTPSNQLTGAHE